MPAFFFKEHMRVGVESAQAGYGIVLERFIGFLFVGHFAQIVLNQSLSLE
jgi:hypothetical protein